MFSKVLIANRSAISCRVQRTLKRMGVGSVAVYSDADEGLRHHLMADEAVRLPGSLASETYLDGDKIIAAALETGAGAIHPGYGFLSENADFARACEAAGLVFLGPTPEQLHTCGLKHVCRDIAKAQNAPLLEGSDLLETAEDAITAAEKVGFPVILKSSAGGGGIGMQIARKMEEIGPMFDQVRRLAVSNFSDASVFLERYIDRARHIEVQCFGDGQGKVVAFGDRDCSMQRRNQKIIEECPAPGLTDAERAELQAASVRVLEALDYRSAGTVEFLWDDIDRSYYLLEVNARLQVEHGVTEEVFGVDLVEWMVRLGAGELDDLESKRSGFTASGNAIEARIYAEDPNRDFQPSTGLITEFREPSNARCETGISTGDEVSGYYDPMVAKIIVHGENRDSAIDGLATALDEFACHGIETNRLYVIEALATKNFRDEILSTKLTQSIDYRPSSIDVMDAGMQTTVQDYPGRVGMWDVGVPPSGPFDSLSFRLGNRILGNEESAAGLEMLIRGAKLRFHYATRFCLTGADCAATLDEEPIAVGEAIEVAAGQVLKTGTIFGAGQRAYLLIEGGIDVPLYLNSRSTFRMGRFGGHGGRALLPGDVLHAGKCISPETTSAATVPEALMPKLVNQWDLRVTYGPHAAPEFFTPADIEMFFGTDWEIHYNSDRTGVRLIGPKPEWARRDGGEAGLHPSNIHDNAYTVGSVDFTGDMPILLGPDGPSLGGFVCPAVVIKADIWKMGQLKPGNTVRFHCVTVEQAEHLYVAQEESIKSLETRDDTASESGVRMPQGNPILRQLPARGEQPSVCFRASGDGVILVEFGEMELDLDLRFRAQALYQAISSTELNGILELVPGIRSLQIQFDPATIPGNEVLDRVVALEKNLPPVAEMAFPSRIVHLPLSWDDPATREAIEKYTRTVRADAPWCPSNIEFIRRINGLESIEEVKRIVYDASYFVMGLGDVYLGAPVATPLDPRHRLVTTKYNPARTWTAENSVGIGGAYLCIYGMEGPGGYQFVGRTLPVWNRFRTSREFKEGSPWLLRFFDQIRWYPVEADELLEMRRQFITGEYSIKIEETTFRPGDYHDFLSENSDSIEQFRNSQRSAYAEERERWEEAGAMDFEVDEAALAADQGDEVELPEGAEAAVSPVSGTLWKYMVEAGAEVAEDEALAIIESMKMEITVQAPCAGTVGEPLVTLGDTVKPGQPMIAVMPSNS